MQITRKEEGGNLVIAVDGCVDTVTAPELETGLNLKGDETLTLDLAGVPYMSSAGLRVLLMTQKKMMAGGGKMSIANVQSAVKDVFDLTGFSGFFTLV